MFIVKEVNHKEFKMFEAFGPSYFQYMSKVLFHNVSSSLAKILGAYVIKITQNKLTKKRYVLVLENLGLGIN
jgi:1-phosphatidylinositol-3-phosphate 5-kinase